jgi:hypothetical protein
MATSTIQTNAANDLYLPDGQNLLVISGAAACSQNILLATLMRLGEDVFNQNSGVDYFGTIFTPQVSYDAARKSISDAIMSCPDVYSIQSLTITIDGNTFNFSANVVTAYGPLTVSN